MPFIYDPRLHGSGYRDTVTGKIISYQEVRTQLERMLRASSDATGALSDLVSDKIIDAAAWREAMRQEIKDNYITQYLLGIGGREMMTAEDWGSVGGMIADQYRYLEGFYAEVASGKLSRGQIDARSRMYINSSREAYERALARASARRGKRQQRWMLSPAEHCEDCVALAGEGWKPVTEPFVSPSTGQIAIPGNGATQCLTNCKCHVEYR